MSEKPQKTNDLQDFMVAATQEMASEYRRIQKRTKEDPGTAGDQGEENWATLLRKWVPSHYHVVTKGRILGHTGHASPQVDVLVLHPSYPPHLRKTKLYLAGGVMAAFECKLTLRPQHVMKAQENAVRIRHLQQAEMGSLYRELQSPLLYGLLAHSHRIGGDNYFRVVPAIEDRLYESNIGMIQHPREMLDFLCIADTGTWNAWKYVVPDEDDHKAKAIRTSYFGHGMKRVKNGDPVNYPPAEPVGAFLTALLVRLAWEDVSLRRIADYFFRANLLGGGAGLGRDWPLTILSDVTRERLAKMEIEGMVFPQWDTGNFRVV